MSLVFMPAAFASTSLKHMIAEQSYFLEVEWDQNDMQALQERTEAFTKSLSSVSESEIKEYLRSIKADTSSIDSSKSLAEELMKIEKENAKQGANWNGTASTGVIVAGVMIGFAIMYYAVVYKHMACGWYTGVHTCEKTN